MWASPTHKLYISSHFFPLYFLYHNPCKQEILRDLIGNNTIMRQSDRATEWKWPCACLEQTNISSANTQGTPASQLYSGSHICQRLRASSLWGGVRGGKGGRKREIKDRKKEKQSLTWVYSEAGTFQGKCRLTLNIQTTKRERNEIVTKSEKAIEWLEEMIWLWR